MAIKDILVHLSGNKTSKAVVDAAITLAQKHEARLIGLFAGVPYDMPSYVVAQLPAEVIQAHQKHVRESAEATAEMFEHACKNNGIAYETRDGDWRYPVADVICNHARYADLVMTAQPDEDGEGGRVREVADMILLRGGAPVIYVPKKSALQTMGERVLVGWDGGVHAARAVRDALPVLLKASMVKVLAIDPTPGIGGLGDLPGADLSRYLATHGVKVEADHRTSGGLEVGEVMLNTAADMSADMIVTGGYGHSRIGELILGGVTDTLMREMTVPVLMSH